MQFTKTLNSLSHHPLFMVSEPGRALKNSPLGFIDIGARGGAHDLVEPLANCTAVLGFEPDKAECERLLQNPAVYEPWAVFCLEMIALADKKGSAELVLLSADTNHSLLPPNLEFTRRYNMVKWQEVGREKLETETLDTILFDKRKEDILWGEFLKLDTQGTEYEILMGAARTLSERTVAIWTEVAFCELYKGQKLFSEVEILLRNFGFSFYGFMPIRGRSQKLLDKTTHITAERALYADAIFFKDPLPGGWDKKVPTERDNYVLFTCALILGYYDYALELARNTWLKKAFPEESSRIHQLILELATAPPKMAYTAVTQLMEEVKSNPEKANILVGNFVDRRRKLCDYDDVLNISPLPVTR